MEEELEIEGYEEFKAHEEVKKDDLSADVIAGQKKKLFGGRDRLYSSSEIIQEGSIKQLNPDAEEHKIIQE